MLHTCKVARQKDMSHQTWGLSMYPYQDPDPFPYPGPDKFQDPVSGSVQKYTITFMHYLTKYIYILSPSKCIFKIYFDLCIE
jgi:hypothetical protein